MRYSRVGAQWLLVAALVGLGLWPRCEQAEPERIVHVEETPERLGFYLETLPHTQRDRPDSVRFYLRCRSFPDEIPQVTVGDSAGVLYHSSLLEWFLPQVRLDTIPITLRITWKGDTLTDSWVVPVSIDTVFVNGRAVLMKQRCVFEDTVADTGYHVSWEPVTGGTCYQTQIRLYLLDADGVRIQRTVDTLLHSQDFHIPSPCDGQRFDYVAVEITPHHRLPIGAKHLEPHVESERMYCYENVVGETFELRISGP